MDDRPKGQARLSRFNESINPKRLRVSMLSKEGWAVYQAFQRIPQPQEVEG